MKEILLLVSLYAMLYPFIGIRMLHGSTRIGRAFSIVLSVDIFLVATGVTIPQWFKYLGFNYDLTEAQADLVGIIICLAAALGSHIFIYHLKQIARGK